VLDHLKANNRAWVERMLGSDGEFFKRLERQQAPEYLWIGCADSRVILPPLREDRPARHTSEGEIAQRVGDTKTANRKTLDFSPFSEFLGKADRPLWFNFSSKYRLFRGLCP